MTIETASLRMLSPKTNMFSVGSTSKAWKIASVATGSTAEIREPNAKLNAKRANMLNKPRRKGEYSHIDCISICATLKGMVFKQFSLG